MSRMVDELVALIGRVTEAASRRLRAVEHALLRGLRLRRAVRTLRSALPRKITVLCYGNVCRSPYMEAALRRELGEREYGPFEVDSAGFVGPDRDPPALAQECALARGIDVSAHRSRIVTLEIVGDRDLVIVMDVAQRAQLHRKLPDLRASVMIAADLDPLGAWGRTIPDPWGKSRADFETSFDHLDRCVRTLADALAPRRA